MCNNKTNAVMSTQIQIGSTACACEVIYGLNERDGGKIWRSIAITTPEVDTGLHQHVKTLPDGRPYLNIKVSSQDTDGYAEVKKGDSIMVIVYPEQWSFDGRVGESLRVAAMRLVPKTKKHFVFV